MFTATAAATTAATAEMNVVETTFAALVAATNEVGLRAPTTIAAMEDADSATEEVAPTDLEKAAEAFRNAPTQENAEAFAEEFVAVGNALSYSDPGEGAKGVDAEVEGVEVKDGEIHISVGVQYRRGRYYYVDVEKVEEEIILSFAGEMLTCGVRQDHDATETGVDFTGLAVWANYALDPYLI